MTKKLVIKMFRKFYLSLSPFEKERFAAKAGTTQRYIESHFLSADPMKRKVPRPELLSKMVSASEGALTYKTLAHYFYIEKALATCDPAA